MKLIEYLPDFLRNIKEFREITNTEEISINTLKDEINKVLQEIVINTASSYGLERYEKIFQIKNDTNDVTQRRFKLLSKINNRVPYSYNWLVEKLDTTLGKGNYILNIDCNKYSIKIEVAYLFQDVAEILNKDLREQLPANLIIVVNLFMTENMNTNYAISIHTGDFLKIRQVV